MADIRVVADIYGKYLLNVSPGTSFLDLSQARALLDSIPASLWRRCLDKQGNLKLDTVDDSIHVLEFFFWAWAFNIRCSTEWLAGRSKH